MKKILMALVIGLSVASIAGCAEGVEDPQPAPEPDPHQKQPPLQTFGGELSPIQDPHTAINQKLPSAPELPNINVPVPQPSEQ